MGLTQKKGTKHSQTMSNKTFPKKNNPLSKRLLLEHFYMNRKVREILRSIKPQNLPNRVTQPFAGGLFFLTSTCCSVCSSSMLSGVHETNNPAPKIATIIRYFVNFIMSVFVRLLLQTYHEKKQVYRQITPYFDKLYLFIFIVRIDLQNSIN